MDVTTLLVLDALRTVNGRLVPDVRDAVLVVPLRPHGGPLLAGELGLSIEREVGPGCSPPVPPSVFGDAFHYLGRREVPEMAAGEVLARGRVLDARSFIRLRER